MKFLYIPELGGAFFQQTGQSSANLYSSVCEANGSNQNSRFFSSVEFCISWWEEICTVSINVTLPSLMETVAIKFFTFFSMIWMKGAAIKDYVQFSYLNYENCYFHSQGGSVLFLWQSESLTREEKNRGIVVATVFDLNLCSPGPMPAWCSVL